MPVIHRSPNSIPPAQTYIAFLISVAGWSAAVRACGMVTRRSSATRLAWGFDRFPSDDTIRNLFLRFGMGEIQRFFEPMTEWMMDRLPQPLPAGHSLDLDSTVFSSGMDNSRKEQ